jgi:hypothetical protein
MKATVLFLICCGLIFQPLSAQTYRKGEINLENFVEELFAMQRTDADYEDLYESLLQVFLNPINLNKTSPEELGSLYILTPSQIHHFFEHQRKNGPMISLYELQAIPEFDLETIYKILPFVELEDNGNRTVPFLTRVGQTKDAYLIMRQNRVLQTRKGYTPADTLSNGNLSSRYIGDPNNLYLRFRMQQGKDFSFGFTLDKDPGEQFLWQPETQRYGFNFFSYHLSIYNRGNLKSLSIGDFQWQFGQGLVYGAGFSVGKGAETITTTRRSTVGLRPYTAAMEYGFFRGVSASYQFGPVLANVFASKAPRDGNIQVADEDENGQPFISSLPMSGLHRTPTELSYRRQAKETNLGANVHWIDNSKRFQIGLNTLWSQFSQPIQKTPQPYNNFEFAGKENHVHSAYFSFNLQNHLIFGETAISQSGGKATVIGMMSSLHRSLSLSVLWRNYERNFHSFYGNSFSEGSRPINENGVYTGIHFKPNSKFSWSIYYDYFKFPWLKYRVYAPSQGHEWLTRFQYTPSKKILLFIQIREESKARNISLLPGFQSTYQLAQGSKFNYVFNLDYGIDKIWSIKTRVMGSTFAFNGQRTRGFAISQDLNADFGRWRVSSRIVLFDTQDFDNRQFIYERNVLWAFSIPALQGQGMRYYLLAQYKISRKFVIWARWGSTVFTDRETIGSGLQEIQGNTITETTFQLQYLFNR